MTSRTLVLGLLTCGLGAGCGNYSNEDLEFMAAVPTTTDLAVELPAQAIEPGAQQAQVRLRRGHQHRIGSVRAAGHEIRHLRGQLAGAGIQHRGMPGPR